MKNDDLASEWTLEAMTQKWAMKKKSYEDSNVDFILRKVY